MITLLLSIAGLFGAQEVVESNTGKVFDPYFVLDDNELVLTGVDRRRALGRDAYAVAHYIDADAAPTDADATARLDACIAANTDKVLIFHGAYPSVPAHGIRHSWKKHFRDLGMEPREDFVKAFTEPFRKDERLYFIARDSGRLEVRHETRLLGEWNDPELVRALWAMCLGPAAEIVNRENLVALRPNEIARRDTAEDNLKEPITP